MGSLPAALLAELGQAVTVEAYAGVSAGGVEQYATGVTVQMFVEHAAALDRGNREMVTSEGRASTRAYGPLSTVAPIGSRITLADGTVLLVMETIRHDGGASAAPSHLELRLQ